jgi:threonine/homoserine/homoserine lactone efflux protein
MLAGMLLGFVGLIGAGLLGVGGVLLAVPGSRLVLTAGASAYMAYLAVGLWRASPPTDSADAAPLMTWWQMGLFQVANPKTWMAVLTFVTGKLGPGSPGGASVDLLGAVCFLAVIGASASLWTVFGAALRTHLSPGSWRGAMRLMAVAALLSIPTLWW